jgi:hypothetical protein
MISIAQIAYRFRGGRAVTRFPKPLTRTASLRKRLLPTLSRAGACAL